MRSRINAAVSRLASRACASSREATDSRFSIGWFWLSLNFSVMVVGPEDKVEQRLVLPAQRIGSLWVIGSGLKSGDRVILDGLQKLAPGAVVAPQTVKTASN